MEPVERSRARRVVVAATLVVLAVVALAAPASADNGSPQNDAVAVNTHDGSSVFKLAFDVRQVTDSTVAPENAAVAYASCSNCKTVAIAVQIVFVVGSPSTFTPDNVAVAENDECTSCDTLATAYQFIVQTATPVRLTNEGRHELDDIEKQLRALDQPGLDAEQIQARVDALMQQLAQVLASDVEPIPGQDRPPPDASDSTTTTSSVVTTTSTTVVSSGASTTSTSTTTSTTVPVSASS